MTLKIPQKSGASPRRNQRITSLTEELTLLAHQLGESSRLPTTRELCQRFQVSSVTLRTALETLEARQIIRRHPRSGLYVSEKLHRKRIAVLVGPPVFRNPDRSPFWGELLTLCVEETDRRSHALPEDFTFHLINQREALPSDHPILEQVRAGEIHGIIALGVQLPGGAAGVYDRVPVVHFASGGPWVVLIDYQRIRDLGMEALQRQGCQHILVLQPSSVKTGEVESSGTLQEQGFRAAMEFFGPESPLPAEKRPYGLLSTDDVMTTGVLAAFRQLGVRPGEDVLVATHSNIGSILLFGYERSLIRIEVDPAEIVQTLFGLLERLLQGEKIPPGGQYLTPRLAP